MLSFLISATTTMIIVWVAFIVISAIIELETQDLITIWFTLGAIVALIACALKADIIVQFIIFLGVSGVAILCTRPLAKKMQNKEIIRRNNKRNSSINEYTWNQLPKFNDAYEKLDKLSPLEKQDLIENYVLPRKVIEKRKNDNVPSKKSSCEVFIEEVNNYVRRKNY